MSQYIFLDESGDLGFNPLKKNSKFFIVTILFSKDKSILEKITKTIHKGLRKRVKKISGGILHSYKEKPETRRRMLELLSTKECAIMVICLNKSRVFTHLKDEKYVLYNYVTNILLDRIMRKKLFDISAPIMLVAARRETKKFLNQNFTNYLKHQVESKHKLLIQISVKSPNEEKSLQVVDFISWAIFRKYELKDESYYEIIKKKIIEENTLFQ